MDGDIETFDVERLEEDFGSLFSVLGWIKGRFGLYIIVIGTQDDANSRYRRTRRK